MDPFSEICKEKMAALISAHYATTLMDDVPSKIEEGLYVGSLKAASNKNALKSLNITHILTVCSFCPPSHGDDLTCKIIPVSDHEDTNLAQYFDECFNFIEEARRTGGGVLVHCVMGKSRSVTIVVAYLMKKHGMTFSQALEHVKTKRPLASPNAGFIRQLNNFEKSLLAAAGTSGECGSAT